MRNQKNEAGTLLPMTVMEDVTVNVLPSEEHEYLMTTKEVASGYGISEYTLRRHKMEQSSELIDGKHFVTAVQILNGTERGVLKIPHNTTLWTKRGIVRLGFFIRSEQAKLFRNWAEELIITIDERRDLLGSASVNVKNLPSRRKHNRLTQERLLDIMADVCKITDHDLRIQIRNKLMGGRK
jgi:hypothetical protein